MAPHISIDLETLSTEPNAFIIAIGAARFDPFGDGIIESFYTAVDLNEVPAHVTKRFDLSPDTIGWWLHKDRSEARNNLAKGCKTDIASALEGFCMWFGDEPLPVWGNGATFGNVILRQAFKVLGMDPPWTYRFDRDLRTLKALAPELAIDYSQGGVAHYALDDAIAQALMVQDVVNHLHLTTI